MRRSNNAPLPHPPARTRTPLGEGPAGHDTTTIDEIDSDDDEWMAAQWEQEDLEPREDDEDWPPELSQDSDEFVDIINRVENLVGKRRATMGIRARARMLVYKSIQRGSVAHTIKHAQRWGGVWSFSREVILRDEEFIRNHHGIPGAARRRCEELADNRLSEERVRKHVDPTNPNWEAVMALAAPHGGVPVMVPDNFVPNGKEGSKLPTLSQSTRSVGGALRRMVSEGFHEAGLCFVVRTEQAAALAGQFHCSPALWAPKDGKEQGRNCNNCSNGGSEPTNQPLNSEELKTRARALWQAIQHPTVEDWVRMIAKFAADAVASGRGNERIRLWKMDIAGAYTLLTYRAEDVHLMACALPGDFIAFFLGGTFGWGAMPFAFQVITRAVQWELNEGSKYRIKGQCLMYVDDICGVSFHDEVESDLATVKRLVEGLLGEGAIADKKTAVDINGQLEVIGYKLDYLNQRVGISEKNVLKAFYAAYTVRDGIGVTLPQMQRVASHASRYKRVCPLMAPFCNALHSACKAHTRPHIRFNLNPEQLTAVEMMRTLLLLTEVDGVNFTRSFTSFTTRTTMTRWVIEYDASLTGVGIVWYRVDQHGGEEAVGRFACSLAGLNLVDGMMNTAEFIAGTLGVRGLSRHTDEPTAVRVRGDNRAAMKWARTSSYKTIHAVRAAVVHVAQRTKCGLEVTEAEHLPHTKAYDYNWRCDWASRGRSWSDILAADRRDTITGRRLHENVPVWEVDDLGSILALCGPRRPGGVDDDFVREVLDTV